MVSYSFALVWGGCLLLSFVGWGALVGRLLFRTGDLDWGMKAAWGMSFAIFVGGLLNLFAWISRTVIFVQIGLGLFFWLVDVLPRRRAILASARVWLHGCRHDRLAMCGLIVFCLLLVFRYASGVCDLRYMGPDDPQAYFVFPNRMLQEGSMGLDPFCTRKLTSALGGHSYLQTYVLCALWTTNLHLMDPLLGLIISVGLLLSYARQINVPERAGLWIAVLLLLVGPPFFNRSSLTAGLALFLCLVRTLEWLDRQRPAMAASAAIIALTAAAICTLKSSAIASCGTLVVLSYGAFLLQSRMAWRSVGELPVMGLLWALFLLPWMLHMYQSSGTFLFPLLGVGYYASAYGGYSALWSTMDIKEAMRLIVYGVVLTCDVVALALMGAAWLTSRPWKLRGREAVLACVIAAVLGYAVTTLGARGARARHAFPCLYAAIFILMMLHASRSRKEAAPKGSRWPTQAALLAFGMLLAHHWPRIVADARFARGAIRQAVAYCSLDRFATDRARMVKVQAAIPERARFLAVVRSPFLLDFARNKIYVFDMPGVVSPPPGIPVDKGSKAVATYLLSHGIRYVAFSYANNAGYVIAGTESTAPLNRQMFIRTFACLDILHKLSRDKQRIFDDGTTLVMDIAAPAQ